MIAMQRNNFWISVFALISLLTSSYSFSADSSMKSATISFITESFISHRLAEGSCGKLLNIRPTDQAKLRQILELGKPYMNASELDQLRSGELERYIRGSAQQGADGIISEARRFLKNEKEICIFATAYTGGRKQAFRDQISNMGGPPLR